MHLCGFILIVVSICLTAEMNKKINNSFFEKPVVVGNCGGQETSLVSGNENGELVFREMALAGPKVLNVFGFICLIERKIKAVSPVMLKLIVYCRSKKRMPMIGKSAL